MAPRDPADGEPAASAGTEALDRLDGVSGTGRKIPTRRRAAGAQPLIPADHDHLGASDAAHDRVDRSMDAWLRRSNTVVLRAPKDMAAAGRPAPISQAPGARRGPASVTIARRRRRSRLRATALPTERPIAYPTRGGRSASLGRNVTVTPSPRTRVPSSRSAVNVDRSRIRQVAESDARLSPTPTGDAGPWPDARAGWLGRLGWTSGDGTRGALPACGCSADTCASPMASCNRRASMTRQGRAARRG